MSRAFVTNRVISQGMVQRFVAVLGTALFLFAMSSSVAHAAITTNTATYLIIQNQTIKASSNALAVIALNIAGNASEQFASTSISVSAGNSFAVASDLATLGTATSSGIALYRDDKVSGTFGTFDAADDVVPLSAAPVFSGATTTLIFVAAETVLANDTGNNAGSDYYLVFRTAAGATNNRTFAVRVYPGEVKFNSNQPTATPTALTPTTIGTTTIDTVAPTFSSNISGPTHGATNVPISTFIHMGFNEALDQTTINSTNVTLTLGDSTAVGAAIRPFYDGFDIISSSPPTYATSSRFGKLATGGTAFFQIQGTSTIYPQGAYSTPLVGDVVYTQYDTFPPEVGIITNATLTSGTFTINDFAPFRPLQITKVATPNASGAVTGSDVIGIGDLVVANTSANPTNVRYDWHIASTSAAVNNSALRFDDATGAPTFISGSSFARIMPNATSTIDGTHLFVATTTFVQGDIVFAKLKSGGDNVTSYGWHLVTTAEVVSGKPPIGATGTTSALRLDGASVAPTFAANSVVAKLTPGAEGTANGGAQNATVFSFADLVLAKVTANAANTGSYAFHIVSNGGTGATSTALRLDNSSGNLTPSTYYIVTATTGITDAAGNPLAANQVITFTTGATTGTNTTPPFVQSSQPQPGSQTVGLNSPLKLTFSVAMNSEAAGVNSVTNSAVVKLSTDVNGTPTTAVAATNTYDSTTNTVTITPTVNLATSTNYVVQVLTTARSSTGTSMPMEYRLYFRAGTGADLTVPTVLGASPANGTLGISRSQVFSVGFSEDMNPATITTTTVTLKQSNNSTAVTGNVSYSPSSRSANFVPTTLLSANEGYTLTVVSGGSGVKDPAGNALAANYTTLATTTSVSDATAPSVAFATADNFGVAVTFTETMKTGGGPNAADNIANYTLESPLGSTISLGGKTITYDSGTKTARISGVSIQNGGQFKITVGAPVQDLASNGISTSGSPAGNIAVGTVQNSSTTGGQLGPGMGSINHSMQGMNPTRITPSVRLAGGTAVYKAEFLAGTSIPSGGQIVLTFPAGFTISGAEAQATTTSFCNRDLNGPASGTTTIAAISANQDAGTVTVTTGGDATGSNTFICLDISNIVNSTVPSSAGYSMDIKTKDTAANSRAILETKTCAPFFLGAAGSGTLTVNVFKDNDSDGVFDAGEALAAARVFLFSPATGGQSATTSASGVATFTSLSTGDYMVGIDPSSVSGVGFNSAPQMISATTTTVKNFALTASTLVISGTVTGPSGTKVDVFGSSNTGFTRTSITLTGSADAYSLPVSPTTTYSVGVVPAMPDTFFTPGAPPPQMPTFTFMPPPSITVPVSSTSVTGKNFTLSATSKTIAVSVLDANGSAVSNAGVFARPVSTSTMATGDGGSGFGTGGMTNTSGAVTLNVIPGTYLVGVAKPGMPNVSDQEIVVPTSGANSPTSLTFKLSVGSSLTISGTVKDATGNAVPYAGVGGRRVNSTSDTTPVGGGSNNFIGGPTDANGAYTLYVSAGVWVIEAYAPGLGKLGSKTITVTTSSLSGQDFSAETLSLGTITGQATKGGTATQGVVIRAEGSAGGNMVVTDSSGNYSMKVPAGSYTLYCMFPGVGEAAPITGVTVTADTTTSGKNCTITAPITISVRVTDGTSPVTGAYVDVQNSDGRGNGTNDSTSSGAYATYVVTVAPGTYTVRVGHPAFGPISSTASVSTTQTITATTTAGALFTITGTVKAGGSALSSAWVSLSGIPTGQTNRINMGAQSGSDGTFSISIPAGSYQMRADKPGYMSPTPSTLTVTASADVGDVTMTAGSLTISGSVTLSGSGVANAFVDANDGSGGFAIAQTDSAGAYSLSVKDGTWTLTARSMGYSGTHSVTMGGISKSNENITLSAISGFTLAAEKQETITPTEGGIITNSNIGSGFKMNFPPQALGTGANASTVKTQSNTAVPNPASGTVLSKNAVSISAIDSGGNPVKKLGDEVTIVIPYTEADLPSGTSETDLQLGVWNDSTQTYDTLSTTVDTTNNTLTAVISHFSDIAPIVPAKASSSSGSTPAAATTASSGGGGGGGGSAGGGSATPRLQTVYPDGRIVYIDEKGAAPKPGATIAQAASSGAATVRSAPNVETPKVSVAFTKGLSKGARGSDVSRLQQLLATDKSIYPDGTVSGFFGTLTQAAVERFQEKYGIAKRGDDGFGTLGPRTRAKITEVFGDSAGVSASAVVSVAVITRGLSLGTKSDAVRSLQVVLNKDPETQIAASGDGAPGSETNYYGVLTQKAVERFQIKYNIAKQGDPGFGYVGPKTRAKISEISQQ